MGIYVDVTKPHWRCICGVVAMPLNDDTKCKCKDYYEQDWTRIVPPCSHERLDEDGICRTCGEDRRGI